MNQNAYIQRTYRKFDNILNLYAAKIFRTVGYAEHVLGMETDEHFRLPPDDSVMTPIKNGTEWGSEYGNLWLKTRVTAPAEAEGGILCIIPDADFTEILCFKNGKPNGIINSKNRFIGGEHSAFFLDKCAKAGTEYEAAFECYAGHTCYGCAPYDNYGIDDTAPMGKFRHMYNGLKIAVVDKLYRDFVFDLSTVLQMARLPSENYASKRAHEAIMESFPYLIGDVLSASEDELRDSCETICKLLAPALEKQIGGDPSRGHIGVIGHSHMDTAWLWPVSETIRKCARTYSQTLNLMEMYPDYTFMQSSALHLDWMKTYYPDIFEGIKAKVAEGRYEPNGGVWVECDCNITGGEAMVRQFLYGQRFTQKELNYRSDSFWLPDTFGYNGAIPQIMQGSGVKYFYTTKMSWSDLNTFPADTFVWRGIDGSEVITHLNRMHLTPDVPTLLGAVNEIRDKRSNDRRLVAYGYGDGGGGPTYGQLEYLSRIKDMAGIPEIHPTTASAYMNGLEANRSKLPIHDGELYLEFHRGTLTNMHDVKRNNRKAEIALYEMELFNVLSGNKTSEYHDELYKVLLKNQFHDILPGTCIPKVYEICIPEMNKVISDAKAITNTYANELTEACGNTVSLYNPLSFARDDNAVIDGAFGTDNAVSQTYTDADGNQKTAVSVKVPAMESVEIKLTSAKPSASAFSAANDILETPFYTVRFDGNGYISSLIDKRVECGREVRNFSGEALGTLWLGEDMPTAYDNWEVEDDIFMKLRPVANMLSRETVADGAVEYRIRTVYRLGKKSEATVDTVFYANDPRIDFETKLDWHERHTLLKAGFNVAVRTAFVKNEIQYGHVARPTTRNTSLEAAKFEVCNHKWSDVSETRYGVALLNDCKYGLSCDSTNGGGCDMRLTLQRGGCRPDPVTDFGVHYMTYSLLPHTEGFNADTVVKPAYELNIPYIPVDGVLSAPKLFELSAQGIICEAVKNAEDADNAFVLRLYECECNASVCKVSLPAAKRAFITNMLEEVIEELPIVNGEAALSFRPFEIKTLLIER